MTNLALIKIASEKVRENLKLAADKGHDARAIKDIGIGYLVGAAEWLESAIGPELTSRKWAPN
jgi:hypothetical protein